jgi:HAD superfamily hydrolase (TIGR01509 family)
MFERRLDKQAKRAGEIRKFWIGFGFLTAILSILILVVPATAQDDGARLRLVGVDASEFPLIRITLLTADDQSRPITDLSQLTVQEDGVPVTDFSIDKTPAGVDVVLVIDANPDIIAVDDDSGFTRLEKVRESIKRFAETYMNPSGLDRVSIIVPTEDGQGGQYLVQDASLPEEVIAAIEAYQPASLRLTPLNAMLTLALEQMEQGADGDRFHALLLFSDGRRLSTQLSYPILTAQANDSNTPIYAAIVGAVADELEIDNVRRLFEPTRATYVHMPSTVEADPIYAIWQQQGDQLQLSYRSQQRQSGRNQVTINLGEESVGDSFEVTLQPPEILLQNESVQIRRIGATHDSALSDLQPAVHSVTASINWPDGLPRRVSDITLLVNDQPQIISNAVSEQQVESITVDWDISGFGQGEFDLVLTVIDELGYQGTSAGLPVRITSEWPPPPTAEPTPPPAVEEETAAEALPPAMNGVFGVSQALAVGLITTLLLLFASIFWLRRRRKSIKKNFQDLPLGSMTPASENVSAEDDQANYIARLEPIASTKPGIIEVTGQNMTVGQEGGPADIVIPHSSLSLLHARIRHQENEYWLFDEGSAQGSYLNYERLGLAPRKLQDGDVVQFGTVSYRFHLRPEGYQGGANGNEETGSDVVVIMDMDGLMVDTEPLSRRAWDSVLADLGCEPLEDEFYNSLIGHRLWETSEMLVAHYDLPIEASELGWRKKVLLAEILSTEVPVMPGLYEFLAALKQRNIQWAVATSTPRSAAEDILKKIGLSESFQVLAAGDEVPNGKPAPDVYLFAAELLNKAPEQCLAVEDSSIGCRAAHAAGMMVVAIPNDQYMEEKFECADHIMTSLLDLSSRLDEMLNELKRR